jgi:hypothetical protein
MNLQERQQRFETAARADSLVGMRTKFHKLFGVSNSAKVIPGGLQLGGVNLDKVAPETDSFAFACKIAFPPEDEVYFGVYVRSGAPALIARLHEMKSLAGSRDSSSDQSENVESDEAAATGPLEYAARNNNVAICLADDGRLYLRNKDHWSEMPDDRSFLGSPIPVDRIEFAIYPPAASVKRSLLAREFVGYLGRFVGREKVHEVTVWQEESFVGPLMRRLPAALAIRDIRASIRDLGGHYPEDLVDRYHAGLNCLPAKHFVILSGLSGTGKTLIARLYARAVHGFTNTVDRDPLLFLCPVRPEWTDPTALTGYYDVLSNRYIVPPFLEGVLVATAYKDSPVFVLLDEMNLARVEYYFSDVLSAMETGHPISLHSSSVPLEGSTGGEIPSEIRIPHNLFLSGTINIDETTNTLSDKILDRAVVIDMSEIDLAGFFVQLSRRVPELDGSVAVCRPILERLSGVVSPFGQGFGYRTAEEFIRYHHFSTSSLGRQSEAVIDEQMVQKALVKLRGAEGQRRMLEGLGRLFEEMPRSLAVVDRLMNDLNELGSFQNSR